MLSIAAFAEPLSSFAVTAKSMLSLGYLTVFGTVIAFSGYYWILKKTRAIIVSMIAFITPIIAIFLGVAINSESIDVMTAAGSVMVLSGVFLVVRRKKHAGVR